MIVKIINKKRFSLLEFIKFISPGLIILIFLFIKFITIGNQLTSGFFISSTLDFSWQSDISERLLHGYIAGRDFIFTYGPLYQILQSLPSIVFDLPSYISVLLFPLLLSLINYIVIYYILKLTFIKSTLILPFFITLSLVALVLPADDSVLTRSLIPVVFSLIYYRFVFLKDFLSMKKNFILLLPSFLGLYVFDLFILTTMIVCLFILYEVYLKLIKKNKKNNLINYKDLFWIIVFPISLIALGEIIISLILSKNLNYITYSLDTVRNYQYIMSIPFSSQQNYYPLIIPVLLIFILVIFLKRNQLSKEENFTIIILFFSAIIQLKSSVIRTDDPHIFQGAYPSFIIFVIVIYLWFKKLKKTFLLFLIVFIFLLPKINIYLRFDFKNIFENYKLINKNVSFFSIYKLPDYFTKNDLDYFSTLIKNNPGNVMIYPYDTFLLNINHQAYNTFPLQFYAYSNSKTEKNTVEKLIKSPPEYIILSIDTKTAVNLDDIPNFSRNPIIAKWMINNYSLYNERKNHLVLKYDTNKKISDTGGSLNCSVYEINTSKIMKSNIFENLFKPSTYYLIQEDNKLIRLPYSSNTSSILIFDNFDNLKKIKNIIEDNINFEKYEYLKKNLKIIKKSSIPKFEEEFSDFNLRCF